mmetsp:Transcript_21964/g.52249  ORF Transcript_21964/g.52249 Transcript_21964/m.52249 type:complete len:229 (-) Transcript_21964:48-734(-)
MAAALCQWLPDATSNAITASWRLEMHSGSMDAPISTSCFASAVHAKPRSRLASLTWSNGRSRWHAPRSAADRSALSPSPTVILRARDAARAASIHSGSPSPSPVPTGTAVATGEWVSGCACTGTGSLLGSLICGVSSCSSRRPSRRSSFSRTIAELTSVPRGDPGRGGGNSGRGGGVSSVTLHTSASSPGERDSPRMNASVGLKSGVRPIVSCLPLSCFCSATSSSSL